MNKILQITLLIVLFVNPIFAQDKNSTASAEVGDEAIEKIKKIAEDAVDVNMRNKAYSGILDSISEDELVFLDLENKKITASLFITDYFQVGTSKFTEIKQDSLKKGDYIFVTGPRVGDTITANAVYKDTSYFFITGKIATVNSADFSIDVITVDKRRVIMDIESSTRQNLLNIKTKKSEKIGFSKLKEGDSLHIVVKGQRVTQKDERYQASRVLVVPNEYFLQ